MLGPVSTSQRSVTANSCLRLIAPVTGLFVAAARLFDDESLRFDASSRIVCLNEQGVNDELDCVCLDDGSHMGRLRHARQSGPPARELGAGQSGLRPHQPGPLTLIQRP